MQLSRELALIESVLFLENDAVDTKTISKITSLSKEVVEEVLILLKKRNEGDEFGLELLDHDGFWHFAPKKEFEKDLFEYYGKKQDGKLSKAALETLSIIAYSQPITRAEIDAIRGVSSDGVLRQLLQRLIIHEVGKKDTAGRPTQYGTTREFLRMFNLKSLADLPKLDELEKQRFELN